MMTHTNYTYLYVKPLFFALGMSERDTTLTFSVQVAVTLIKKRPKEEERLQ